jgi:hypothetical protein
MNTLDMWPELPIVIYVDDWHIYDPPSVTDVICMLEQNNRVAKIYIDDVPNLLLEELWTVTEPFPALIELDLSSSEDLEDPEILSSWFLGRSVPNLRSLRLWNIPFPAMGKLLLSARDLVTLSLGRIPPSGFILPDAMVDILSTLTKLKTFHLTFHHPKTPRFSAYGASQRLPALTHVVLPALTDFHFYGDSKYLEGIVSRIDAPLDSIVVRFSNWPTVSDIPSFRNFIRRTKIPDGPHRFDTSFSGMQVEISLFQRKGDVNFKVLNLQIPCSPNPNSQLSLLAQVCSTCLPPLPSLELLGIYEFKLSLSRWQDEVDNTRLMELLRPFTTVKDLVLDELAVLAVTLSLQELVGEQITEILPALQNIFLEGSWSLEPVREGISKFVAARKLSGHPVFVCRRETKQ